MARDKKEYSRQYHIDNKEKIHARKRKIIVCKCGEAVTSAHFARHKLSQLHIDIMKMQELD